MKIHQKTPHLLRLMGVLTLIGVVSFQALLLPSAYAATGQITLRSLTLQANGLHGGSAPGVAVTHLFGFTLPTAGDVGSVKFEYCTTAADVGAATCVAPPNMDTTGATLTAATGIAGMQVLSASGNTIVLTHPLAPINLGSNTAATFQLTGVKNPLAKKADNITDEPNYTFYVRISSYASLDATGTAIDKGTVTASTASPIVLTGTMPESLVFCTGATIPFKLLPDGITPTTIPDCANATPGNIKFDQLFDPTTTAASSSQMAASTNAGNGYAITVNGSTLMSGPTNSITAMASDEFPTAGSSQFGINLKANDTTYLTNATGAEINPLSVDSTASNLRGEAYTGYNTVNKFKFASGDIVADSGYTTAGPATRIASDGQIYTVTYIANVPGSQPAGDYSTTLTYICTPTY